MSDRLASLRMAENKASFLTGDARCLSLKFMVLRTSGGHEQTRKRKVGKRGARLAGLQMSRGRGKFESSIIRWTIEQRESKKE